ncbi:motility protein A [Aliifodinibius salipaludis]|uniref:Motility protein A n=1 Tax=Fodinibius salipaludis TaxID=2032627 RepID=A0A2A2GBA9_9BACT|nr:MotA/TolQ/ExbB proton channel family protein [Aliifodinibius salipaludis]PAU94618.1 motility protein A [Aliifodinibius salipaludis]
MLDRSTIIGFVSGFTLILLAIVLQGNLMIFASMSSFLIVAGGVLAATLVNYSYENIKYSFKVISKMMGAKSVDLRTDMELMRMFAKKVRTDGILTLDDEIGSIENDFLQNAIQLAVDGYNKESLGNILDDEIQSQKRQLSISVKVLDSMSEYAPAFGMIGTLIGMILMLQNIDDPKSLGAGLAVALITTLYGTILSNMILGPLAGKLEYLSKLDLNRKEMFRVGVLSMVEEENPRIMENKMLIYLEPKKRAEYKKYHEKLAYGTDRVDRLYQKWPTYQTEEWEKLNENLELETG